MIKQKLQTIPGTVLTGTDRGRMGGQMPSVDPIPTTQVLPYLNGGTPGSNPLTNGSDTQNLPLFSPSAGYSDTGAQGH